MMNKVYLTQDQLNFIIKAIGDYRDCAESALYKIKNDKAYRKYLMGLNMRQTLKVTAVQQEEYVEKLRTLYRKLKNKITPLKKRRKNETKR